MPWQRLVADVGLELKEDGRLAYREVVVSVMRQHGKSTLVLCFEAERCFAWSEPQRVAYTAQTGWDARRKLIDDHAPQLLAVPAFRKLIGDEAKPKGGGVFRGTGNEHIAWAGTGSRIDVPSSSSGAGHGKTIDLGVIDEAWKDEDDRREQALLPAMATRDNAQLLLPSTAGTDASVYLRRKVEAGRHAAETDPGSGIAYFEWSIPEDADIDDPEVWWAHMPALGRTISVDVVHHARKSMSENEFRRAFGNQWTAGEHERVIPDELWEQVQDAQASPAAPLCFAFDVLPDRSAGAIVVAGGGAVEVVEAGPGASWIVSRLEEIVGAWSGEVVIDGGGPALSLAQELELRGVPVTQLSSPEVAASCARFYDSVADEGVRVRPHDALDAAVAGVAKRPTGDRFVWSRSASTADITPLMAASLAHRPTEDPEPLVAIR